MRPENVRVHVADGAADASGAAGQVEESTFLGSFRRSVVRTDDGAIVHVQHLPCRCSINKQLPSSALAFFLTT